MRWKRKKGKERPNNYGGERDRHYDKGGRKVIQGVTE